MLFKILQGPSSRIGTAETPLHEGYAYFTPDTSGFYIDAQVDGVLTRIQINPEAVFQATRNETTYSEIASAAGRGCAVLCMDGNVVYHLASLNTSAKTALFISMYQVDEDSVGHLRAWLVSEDADSTTTWTRHSKVTTEAIVDAITEQNADAEQKFWRGTQAEYDAIETKDESVLYIVTDEDPESTVVVGDMKASLYDSNSAVKNAGGIAAYTQALVGAVTLSSLGGAAANHTHTKTQITDFPTSMPASDVAAWAKAETKPSYTASEVGADADGAASSAVSTHNASNTAHSDIRTLITTLQTALGEKAKDDLSNVSSADLLAALTAVGISSGGAKIQTGSYVGTGTYGSDNPCSLTFDKPPKFIIVFPTNGYNMQSTSGDSSVYPKKGFVWIQEMESQVFYPTNREWASVSYTVTGNVFSWHIYSTSASLSSEYQQIAQQNKEGTTYCYLAIG